MKSFKLYSFTLPLALLPLLDFSISQIPDYLKGDEFRTVISSLISQLLTGISSAIMALLFGGIFGTL